jgi:ATP synthase protein I
MMAREEERFTASTTSTVARVLLLQLGSSVLLALLFWGIGGRISGFSALLGGLICLLPNAYLALRLTLPRSDRGASGLVRAAYIGELGKIVLTVLLFGLVFSLVRPIDPLALFTGFIATTMVTLFGFLMRDQESIGTRDD